MTTEADLALCGELGVDAAGIVVEYPVEVPWNLDRKAGRRLALAAPCSLDLVMVCSGEHAFLQELISYVQPGVVQLHGDETVEETAQLAEWCRPRGIRVFRALRVDPNTGQAKGALNDPVEAAQQLAQTGVAALVVDSHSAERPGGTGISVALEILRRVMAETAVPVIVAGGLKPHNVASVIKALHPYGVDVLSGVETAPRAKSASLMRRFSAAVRGAHP